MTTDNTCPCGHDDSEHATSTEHDSTVCMAVDCYCGRNPLEWATVQSCEWCTTGVNIVWCRTANGKRMPIEPEPNPKGNCEIEFSGTGVPLVIVHGSAPGMFDDWTPFMPHYATCDRKLKTN